MGKGSHSVVLPITAEQARKEDSLAESWRAAEEEAVCTLLANECSPDQVQFVLSNASGFAEAMTQKHRDPHGTPVACKDGCSWCCYQLVRVSAPEVFQIVRHIETGLSPEARTEVVDRLRKLDRATRGVTPQGRVRIPKSCAFLVDGMCSIYSVRPLACAEFTSYEVNDCKRGKRLGFKSGGVIHEKARMIAFNSIQQGLADGLRRALPETDTAWLELTAAVLQAIDTPQAEQVWLSGGKVFAGAHLGAVRK